MKRFDKKLNAQDIINAIPGGVAIYKVSDIFETVYYSDGVPALSGYSRDEYDLLIKQDASDLIYQEDAAMVIRKIRQVLEAGKSASFEFRKQHRDGHIVWVNVHARKIGEDGGHPLLQCVFHNISAFKQAREELAHVINSIPGGIAAYDFNDMQNPRRLFVPMVLLNFSAAVTQLICSIMRPIPGVWFLKKTISGSTMLSSICSSAVTLLIFLIVSPEKIRYWNGSI